MKENHRGYPRNIIKTPQEIALIEKAGQIVAETLSLIEKHIRPGIEILELDKIAEEFILSKNAIPSFKGYEVDKKFYPNTLCISIDEVIIHGIPNKRQLQEGEIVSVDCGCQFEGYHGDSAYTFKVGQISDEKQKLLDVTEKALYLGIEQAVDKNKVFDISRAVQNYVEQHGYSSPRELVGHGVGQNLHEEPSIPNHVPPLLHRNNFPNMKLQTGMTIAIEPMVMMSRNHNVITLKDGWTIVTSDKSPSAHFEHTVVIENQKARILTARN